VILRLGMLAALVIALSSASDARDKVLWIADQTTVNPERSLTAESEMEVARFYISKRDYTGAINRCKVVVTHFATSRQVEEALMLLVEMYLALHIPKEAQTAAAVLRKKFPNSVWSHIAVEILKSADLEPDEDENSQISRAFR
jgi:outer membrane protein assembly factor BamD